MKIRFILTGEGTSDLRLVDHIENILIDEGFEEVSGEAPDLRMFGSPIGNTVSAKLSILLKSFPTTDIIFVHRDADNAGYVARDQEILSAAQENRAFCRVIPIIPVAMLETWLLADMESLKKVSGNKNYTGTPQGLPKIGNLENIRDSKELLFSVLCEVSQAQGDRLKKFKKRFNEMRARLTCDLDHKGPILGLESYQRFRNKVTSFAQEKLTKKNIDN